MSTDRDGARAFGLAPPRKFTPCECGNHSFVVLTQGFVGLVDCEDVQRLSAGNWNARPLRKTCYMRGKYFDGKFSNQTFFLHRALMGWPQKPIMVDHINGCGLDNRRSNLRTCTPTENSHNRRVLINKNTGYHSASSEFKGVYFRHKKWQSRIVINKKHCNLGFYRSEIAAAVAYDAAAIEHFGDFALTNFIHTQRGQQ